MDNSNITISSDLFLKIFVKNSTIDCVSKDIQIESDLSKLSSSQVTLSFISNYIQKKINDLMIEQYRCLNSINSNHFNQQFNEKQQVNQNYQIEPIYDSIYSSNNNNKNFGKLGSPHVNFDLSTLIGQITLDSSTNTLVSNSGFSTIKTSNCFLFAGKWHYEVLLLSKGIMQLGFASTGGKNGSINNFTIEKGVGDSLNSYSYDGNRIKKWNLVSKDYGERWELNDVIGVCIDLDECNVSFYRNGKPLGIAFDKLPTGQGIVYYPAISLAFNESIIVNFGSNKFKYPVENYQSLEQQDQFEIIKANMLIEWLFNLILCKCQRNENSEQNSRVNKEENIYSNLSQCYQSSFLNPNSNVSNNQCINNHHPNLHHHHLNYNYHLNRSLTKSNLDNLFFNLSSSLIMEELEELLTNEYIIETCLFKHLILYHTKEEIHEFLDSIWSLLNETNLELFFNSIVLIIVYGYQFSQLNDEEVLFSELINSTTTSKLKSTNELNNENENDNDDNHNLINFISQKQYLNLFLLLIEHKRTRIYLLQNVLFKKNLFFQLLDTKLVFDNSILQKHLFPNLTILDLNKHFNQFKLNQNQQNQNLNSTKLNENKKWRNLELENSLIELENIQNMLIDTLLYDELGRTIFIEKFNQFLNDLEKQFVNLNNRQSTTTFSTPLSVLLSVFHRLCSLIRNQYENVITCFPLEFFIDSKYCSKNVTRIGGLFNFLNKNHQKEISIYKFELSNTNPLLIQIFIIIDHLIKLYTLGVHKQLGKYNGVKELLMNEFNSSLKNLEKLNSTTATDSNYFNTTKSVLEQEYLIRGHQYALLNNIIFTQNRKQDIIWLLKIILQTLELASSSGCVFSYLPHYYLVTCLNLITSLRFYFPNESLSTINNNNNQLIDLNNQDLEVFKFFSLFITGHFCDERIVNNDHKEMIAQSLTSLISSKSGLNILENISIEYRLNLIKKLTQSFESRVIFCNLILLKFWRGNGFAFKEETFNKLINNLSIENLNYFTSSKNNELNECNPSIIFQQLLSDYFNSNPKKAYIFLTSLLNQLNFSFSEFVTTLQDIQNSSIRQETFYLDSRQLKICCTCYELSNSLLRVLEMILHYNVSLILTNNNLIYCETFNDLNSINLKNYFGFVNGSFQSEFNGDEFEIHDTFNDDEFCNSNLDNNFNFNNKYEDSKYHESTDKQSSLIKECKYRKQETNEILLQQLCSICNQIINRIIMSSNCFNYVRQQMTNLESINEFNILSSVIGVLIELIKNERTRYLTLNLLINDLNFQLSSYLYLIGETKLDSNDTTTTTTNDNKKKRSSNFIKYLNEDEFKELKRILIYIINFNERNEKLKSLDDFKEEDLCTICYANKKTALFLPCKHESCSGCIQLYLLRKSSECFFCKIQLEKVQFTESNQIIYPQRIKKTTN